MEKLEDLPSAEDLYDYRQSDEGGVPLWLPHNQGDVFANVNLSQLTGEDSLGFVMLFLHPCTMRSRRGALVERATVINVVQRSPRKPLDDPSQWTKHYSQIPLPDFSGRRTDAYAADMFQMRTIPMSMLTRDNRVASFSDVGRSHMLHRIIFHLTRKAVPPLILQQATQRVQTELQLQADWCQKAYSQYGLTSEHQILELEAEFQQLLDREWPDGSPDLHESTRDRLSSENDVEHDEAYQYIMNLCDSDAPGESLSLGPA